MVDKIKQMIQKPIEEAGYILDSVNLEKEGTSLFLRIQIDKEGIVDIEDCVKVTNIVNPILDTEDPIKENYVLDISSKEKGV